MIPSEYKLDFIVARLIERLEGTRRSYRHENPEGAESAFARIADEHLEAALGEYREVAMSDHPELHETFIRREVKETFLPRYTRLALEANASEANGFGLGAMGGILGRLLFGLLALGCLLILPKTGFIKTFLGLLPFVLALPFLPDLLRFLFQRKHRRELTEIVADMNLIQERIEDYEPVSRLSTEELRGADASKSISEQELL